jgi:hypothetical protein
LPAAWLSASLDLLSIYAKSVLFFGGASSSIFSPRLQPHRFLLVEKTPFGSIAGQKHQPNWAIYDISSDSIGARETT